MSEWFELKPENGWEAFAEHRELTEAIWQAFSQKEELWRYMKFAVQSSIWESCDDGSAICMGHGPEGGDRLLELRVSEGTALARMAPISTAFRLMACPC